MASSGPSTKTVTSAYTATISDSLILADATGGAFSVTLPTAVARNGKDISVKKIDSSGNAVTIATTGGQTIDGAATKSLPSQYNGARCVSDNANWWVM